MTAPVQFLSLKLIATVTAILVSIPSSAQQQPVYSDAFGEQVRQYLLDNPEVILEAIEGMEARRQNAEMAERIQPRFSALLSFGPDMRTGASDAETVIIEFFDYSCPICKAMLPVVDQFVADNPNAAVVKKHLPVISPGSERAARYVLAADLVYGTDKSTELHKVLYATSAPMREEVFANAAKILGLDHSAIQAETETEAVSKIIDGNRDIAIELGIIGTPVFIGGSQIKAGRVTVEDLAELSAK